MNAELSAAAVPRYADMLARARALKPALLQRARAAESARTLPAATVDELQQSGLFEIQKPARFGGLELGLVEFVEIVAELGRACGSTAWVYGVTAERAWLAAKFGLEAQREVWGANPGALITSSITPDGVATPVEGGWRVTGHWHFVSGIDIADWCVFCTNRARGEGAPPEAAYFLIPKAQCEIIDTWHVAGLAATGSRDVRVDDVFVPAHRFVPVELLREGGGPGLDANPAPLFRLPLIAVNPYAVLAPMLGIAEGALEQTLEGVKTRRLVKVAGTAAEQQVVQLRIAEAAAEIDAARALILADCREAMACVERGEPMPVSLRIRVRRNQGFAAKLLMSAVDRLFTSAGGRGIYLDHYMQRAFRDVHAAGSHLGLSWDLVGTMWGQHALGLPLSSMAF
jgi:3-hydroxy-9,10-secoandrosta-1,3,5(10)-triene-9,17-dione monooxygenase